MTREEIKELRDDIATVVCTALQNYEYASQDSHLFDEDALYHRIYDDVQDLLEATLSGEVRVCGPGAWLAQRCVPGSDSCMRFFIIYDEQEALCIDLSPYYLLDIGADLVELREFVKIDPIERTILNKILEKGEC